MPDTGPVRTLTEQTAYAAAGALYMDNAGADRKVTPPTLASWLVQPPYIAGRWYHAGLGAVKTGTVVGITAIKLYPFMLARPVTVSDLGARVNTLHAANNFQLAIYEADPTTLLPAGPPKANTGNISTAVEGCFGGTVGTAVALTPGVHWAAAMCSSTTVTFMARDTSSNEPACLIGSATINDLMGAGQLGTYFYSAPATFGTWPNLTGATLTAFFTAAQAALMFKAA